MNSFKKYMPESLIRFYRILKSYAFAIKNGFKSKKLKIIAVTGSSGKSTTSLMLFHVMNTLGFNVGVISTVGAKVGNKFIDTGLHVSTPDPSELENIFKYMIEKGCEYVILEVTSHSLSQGRLGSLTFSHSIITHIKEDHLDWHKTWVNYATAKASIIKKTKSKGTVVINRGDERGYDFIKGYIKEKNLRNTITTFSSDEPTEVIENAVGITFKYAGVDFSIPVLGVYNVENALAVINMANELGLDYNLISHAFKSFRGIKGRMEVIKATPFAVIIDFAHNTDSLEKSLEVASRLKSVHGRVICVFGSAGLRDVKKRYDMGEISSNLADITIITAEDPRIESLEMINSQIIEGCERSGGMLIKRFTTSEDFNRYKPEIESIRRKSVYSFDYENIQNRFDAINFAISIAKEGDIVITEGKGHEESLCFGTIEYPFTDHEAVEKALIGK